MVDIENKVFDTVYNAVIAQYSTATILGEYVNVPAGFPCVTLIEEDNTTYTKTQDDSLQEHHARVMYECNVYANNETRKSTARDIAKLVDTTMQGMKFTRIFFGQTPNEDSTIYRITMRFEAVVAEGATSSGDTTYQMYRR